MSLRHHQTCTLVPHVSHQEDTVLRFDSYSKALVFRRFSRVVSSSIVVAPANDLLHIGSQQNSMLILRRVRSLDVAERWVGLDDAALDEVVKLEESVGLVSPDENT